MKTSTFFAVTGALLAAATPVHLDKKNWFVETVVETVQEVEWTVVTAPAVPAPTPVVQHPPPPVVTVVVTVPPDAPRPKPVVQAPKPVVQAPSIVDKAPKPVVAFEAHAAMASPTDFPGTAVWHHNMHRMNHSAGTVQWSEKYAASAAVLAATCNFHHDVSIDGGGYGQNIAMWAQSGDAKALGANQAIAMAVTDMWYNGEVNLFPSSSYGKPTPDMSNFEGWGHFTAMVWKDTTQVGCAAQYCAPGTMEPGMGAWYTVCNYYPTGNVGGAYGKNVGPPLGEQTLPFKINLP